MNNVKDIQLFNNFLTAPQMGSSWGLDFVRLRESEALQNLRTRDPCILLSFNFYAVEKFQNTWIPGSKET